LIIIQEFYFYELEKMIQKLLTLSTREAGCLTDTAGSLKPQASLSNFNCCCDVCNG
jgi:hypothetical protein